MSHVWSPADDPRLRRLERTALIATGVDAVGTGSFVSAASVIFTQMLAVTPLVVGFGLTLSAVTGMIASLPVAAFADRIGKLRVFTLSYLFRAIGTMGWMFVHGDTMFLAYCAVFGIIDRSAASLTRSLIIAPLSHADSVRLIGKTALPGNAGYGLGAGLSALVIFLGIPFVSILTVNALSFVMVVVLFNVALRGEDVSRARLGRSSISWATIRLSLGDAKRRVVTWENFIFSFHRTLLNVYFPLLVVTRLPVVSWLVPVAFVLNAAVVGLVQGHANAWADHGGRHATLWQLAGFLLGVAILGVGLLGYVDGWAVYSLAAFLLVSQIAAEIVHGAALAVYMVRLSRDNSLATDLSAMNLGGQFQNIAGPTIFSALVSPTRWPLAVVFGVIVLVSAGLAGSRRRREWFVERTVEGGDGQD